ncbi:MAG: DegV family protein [Lachnospiraceae bacterium]|nr:DegV family protein [Lachnospiraceae bacterium]
MKIVTDTSTFFSPEEGRRMGITVIPSCSVIDGEVFRDYEDIDTDGLLERIRNGGIPTTSQPSIGEVMDAFEETDEEILFLSIGDGLSGTYQNAVGVKNSIDDGERVHIIDTKTLGGPHRYLVQKAMRLNKEGWSLETIKKELYKSIETSVSFVIPADFDFLKRSGRLTPIAAKIGGLIKIVPVLTQTADKKRIAPFVVKRARKKAVDAIIDYLKSMGVDENYIVSISHAGVSELAEAVLAQIKAQIANAAYELFSLSPALVTHGGPGCVVIQAIRK